jgi:hypothetical protein
MVGASRRTTGCSMSGVSTTPTCGTGCDPIDRLVAELFHVATGRSDDATCRASTPLPGCRRRRVPAKAAFGPIADKAKAGGCAIHRLHTGHDIMLEAPLLAGTTS